MAARHHLAGILLAGLAVSCGPSDDQAASGREEADTVVSSAPATPTPHVDTALADSVLTPHGWGPLRIGMTEEAVVAAAGPDANPGAVGGPEPDACDEWYPARAPEGMMVMLERGRLSRITLVRDATVRTLAGIGLGATAAEVRAAHPDATFTPHKYLDPPAAYITAWDSGPDSEEPRGIVYETGREGTVTHIHAGGPAIRYVEGCL